MDDLSDEQIVKLFTKAKQKLASCSSYNDQSGIAASVLSGSGKVFTAGSIVNHVFEYSAEVVALLKAISEGEDNIRAILITYRGKIHHSECAGHLCPFAGQIIKELMPKKIIPIITWPTEEKGYRVFSYAVGS